MESAILQFGGDTVQAVQALKESRPDLTAELEGRLEDLLSSFMECRAYCKSQEMLRFPFSRAERQVRDVLYSLQTQRGRPNGEEAEISAPSLSLSLSNRSEKVEKFKLGPIKAPRLLNGLWQLSSPAWGSTTSEQQEQALAQLVETGLTMADMADHYVRRHQPWVQLTEADRGIGRRRADIWGVQEQAHARAQGSNSCSDEVVCLQ